MVFKTPKGTELQLIDLKGKAYLPVAQRLVWLREEKPEWSIETGFDADLGYAKAIIKTEDGRILATAHKSITKGKNYPLETAETGAIGRALALCGYGTQNAGDDLDEGEELADAPIANKHALNANEQANRSNWVGGPTESQLKRLYAISKASNWSPTDVKEYLHDLGVENSKELNQLQYQKLCDTMQKYPRLSDGNQTSN